MNFPLQIVVNILYSLLLYQLIATSFTLIYQTTRFFNLAQAAIISLAAYFTYIFFIRLGLPFFIAIFISIICSLLISLFSEAIIFRYMREKNLPSLNLLIASIGIYTILQNLISLFFGDDTKSIRTDQVNVGYQLLTAYVTGVQIITMIISAVLVAAVLLVIYKTLLGRQIRAVGDNPELCNIYGIDSNRTILWATSMSAVLAAVAGILISLETDMKPAFGFDYLLYGVVAMIIGGVGSYRGLFFGSLLLATAQHLSAYYLDTRWMDAVAYIILILFLIWKPLGFSGQRLKKIEI
jgi:branched-chain amino acid transport system permease protein